MLVTGYQLREAIKRHTLLRDTAAAMFSDSLHKFPGEDKADPDTLLQQFYAADTAIARLQVAQMKYNLAVKLVIEMRKEDGPMTLAEGVKRLGGAARCEKMWRSAATPKEKRFIYEDTRRKDEERAVPALTLTEAAHRASVAAQGAGRLRQAIAVANAREVEIEGLDASLLG